MADPKEVEMGLLNEFQELGLEEEEMARIADSDAAAARALNGK